MKKFRMMLPVLAVVFAVMGAVAGSFMPSVNAYYKIGTNCSDTTLPTEQANCAINQPLNRPVCTVNVNGVHSTAFADEDCLLALRIPQ